MNSKDVKQISSLYKNISLLDRFHIWIRLKRSYFNIVEPYVPKKGTILDFGCGHGFFSLYLSKKSKNRKIIGIDISEKKINIAQSSLHASLVNFSCQKDSLLFLNKKNKYDAIVILNVLYLLDRQVQKNIIKKSKECLKKNGKLLIIEHDANHKLKIFYTKVRELVMIRLFNLTNGNTITFNTHEWWVGVLKKYFREVKTIRLDPWKLQNLYINNN